MSKEGVQAVTAYLDEHDANYQLVEHAERFTAAAEAQAAGIEPGDAAKDLILRDGERYAMAVIPASQRLDLGKARHLLEAGNSLRLATEDEIGRDFGRFEIGAIPPFGPLHEIPQIVDRRLLEHDRVLCSAGDHAHGLLLEPDEIVRVAEARVGDLCEE